MKTFFLSFALFVLYLMIPFTATAQTQDAGFQQRKTAYIDSFLTHPDDIDALLLQAYQGVPLDTAKLNDEVEGVPTRSTADFIIARLVRISYLTNSAYDTLFMPMLDTIPLWLGEGDTLRSYWSENHWAMWNSSNWLLHEKYGRPIDGELENRLKHYLQMKVDYGYYEFFSPIYMPYALQGILNLADFAQDSTIKSLATEASYKLMKDWMMVTNDQGVFYPSTGRGTYNRYIEPYGHNHSGALYLLTGKGDFPDEPSVAGAVVATTSLPLDTVINAWSPHVDSLYSTGHPLDSNMALNGVLSDYNRVLFQWSAGGYFHPQLALESALVIDSIGLWNHTDFSQYGDLSQFPPSAAPAIAEFASPISYSSVIMQQDLAVFKHNGVGLVTAQDKWKGKKGFQLMPMAATVGTNAVLLASGEVTADWTDRPSTDGNIHLPYIQQKSNKALVMYRPDPGLKNFGFDEWDVSILWQDSRFDEVTDQGMWLLGRQDSNYVAVLRHCINNINGIRACEMDEGGQTWAIVVGDASMYGSFSSFQNMISQAEVHTEWIVDTLDTTSTYYAELIVDGDTLDYAWVRDTSLITSVPALADADSPLKLYPNPANSLVTLDLTAFKTINEVDIRVLDIMGKEVYYQPQAQDRKVQLNISNWTAGLYLVQVVTPDGTYTRKLMVD